MIANSRRVVLLGFLTGIFCLFLAGLTLAQEPVERERAERPEITPTTQEVIAAIKRRAQQILEARRAARRLRFSGEVSQLIGY